MWPGPYSRVFAQHEANVNDASAKPASCVRRKWSFVTTWASLSHARQSRNWFTVRRCFHGRQRLRTVTSLTAFLIARAQRFLKPHRRTHNIDAAYYYRRLVVCLSVCMPVCPWDPQKRPNRSRCRLSLWLGLAQRTVYFRRGSKLPSRRKGQY